MSHSPKERHLQGGSANYLLHVPIEAEFGVYLYSQDVDAVLDGKVVIS